MNVMHVVAGVTKNVHSDQSWKVPHMVHSNGAWVECSPPSLDNLLLSRECCQSLGILSKKFPEVLYSSDEKEGGCSAGVGLASPASSDTIEVLLRVIFCCRHRHSVFCKKMVHVHAQ